MPLSRFKPDDYPQLLAEKTQRLTALLAPFYHKPLTVYASPPQGFRMRAEFRFWHEGDGGDYVMFRQSEPDKPVVIRDFPIAHQRINSLMQSLRQAILANDILKRKLFQVEFLATLKGDCLVTLIYHRPLDAQWQARAEQLQDELGCSIIGRSRKQKLMLSRDYVNETLTVNGRLLHYRQVEGSFTQPNACINQDMLAWAQSVTPQQPDQDMLELYCGNGNFTVALAPAFRKVLATEISKSAVKAADHNFAGNGIENVNILRMSSEELTSALQGERVFRRLEAQDIRLDDYRFSTVLVDPPRAGLDPATLSLVADFERIVYISCNPETLTANLSTLCKSHDIARAALFDQFPYTDHIETGVLLVKKR